MPAMVDVASTQVEPAVIYFMLPPGCSTLAERLYLMRNQFDHTVCRLEVKIL